MSVSKQGSEILGGNQRKEASQHWRRMAEGRRLAEKAKAAHVRVGVGKSEKRMKYWRGQ
jgi:hypothetical protein